MPCFGRKERKSKDQVVATTSDFKHDERPASASQVCPAVPSDNQANQQDRIHEKCINRQKASDDKVEELSDTVKQLKKGNKEKNKEIKKLRDEHFKLTEDRNTKYQRVIANMNEKISMQEIDIQNLKVTNEDLLTRLSAMAGARLTDNNANIADLSDVNRPTKLAEKYSELYDNEWTDAYEILMAQTDVTETDACNILLKAFCTVYIICENKAKEDREKMKGGIKTFLGCKELPPELMKQLKDQRKRDFGGHIELLRKDVKERMKEHFTEKRQRKDKTLNRFLSKGIEICWLMVVQDPPVFMDVHIENRHGEKYDCNSLKPYTRSGQYIDYIVWPPLYLYEGGNILIKGIVQCKTNVATERDEPHINQANQEMVGTKAKQHRSGEKTKDPATEETSASDTNSFNKTQHCKPSTLTDHNETQNGNMISVASSNSIENENISEHTNLEGILEAMKETNRHDQKTMNKSERKVSIEAIANLGENRLTGPKIDNVKNENESTESQKKKERQKQTRATKTYHSAFEENRKPISNSDVKQDQTYNSSSHSISEAKPSASRKRHKRDNKTTLKHDKPEEDLKSLSLSSSTVTD